MIAVLTGWEKRTSVSKTFDSRDPSGRLLDLRSMTQGIAAFSSNLRLLFLFVILFFIIRKL